LESKDAVFFYWKISFPILSGYHEWIGESVAQTCTQGLAAAMPQDKLPEQQHTSMMLMN